MQKKMSLTNLYFNRFLAIRYTTAFFLFLNLYLFIFLSKVSAIAAILPLFLFILSSVTALEQVKLYRNHSNHLPYAHFLYRMVFVSAILSLLVIYSPLLHILFSFSEDIHDILNLLAFLFLLSLLISFLMLIKLKRIKSNSDPHFKRIKTYEEIIN